MRVLSLTVSILAVIAVFSALAIEPRLPKKMRQSHPSRARLVKRFRFPCPTPTPASRSASGSQAKSQASHSSTSQNVLPRNPPKRLPSALHQSNPSARRQLRQSGPPLQLRPLPRLRPSIPLLYLSILDRIRPLSTRHHQLAAHQPAAVPSAGAACAADSSRESRSAAARGPR
ncbi:hypothetical protein BCR44DRAFT_1192104 [Catenaria anguillulae PL171]|uniref:Uncharacterized protein n=1 Tax=Catenaria anguillulae PL171 TaxID=765915 RepID=A0A1Y2H3K3_9FUNG|nr:hypothetical protein BCR44DRAFT_1192104 [Catenaria anguillulae PL171]